MKFPVAVPLTLTLSSANLALGYDVVEVLRQGQALARIMGPSLTAKSGSLAAADVLAIGSALARSRQNALAALDEAFLDSTTYLLSDWERMLGLVSGIGLPVSTRRNRLIARWRSLRGGSPKAIIKAVLALFGSTPPSLTLVENTVTNGPYADPRAVFVFALVIPDLALVRDRLTVALIRETVDPMKPAHTRYYVTNKVGFLTDDPDSLTDLTLLGI